MVHMSDTQFNRVLRAMRSACGVFMACEVYTSFSVTNLVVYTQTLRLWNAKRFINFLDWFLFFSYIIFLHLCHVRGVILGAAENHNSQLLIFSVEHHETHLEWCW